MISLTYIKEVVLLITTYTIECSSIYRIHLSTLEIFPCIKLILVLKRLDEACVVHAVHTQIHDTHVLPFSLSISQYKTTVVIQFRHLLLQIIIYHIIHISEGTPVDDIHPVLYNLDRTCQ